jgi:formylglycine-generating enzyme required for sulfatase activity
MGGSLVLAGCKDSLLTPIMDDIKKAEKQTTSYIVSLQAIPGVTAPVVGAVPVTTITETTQYTGTVAWSGSPSSFAASTEYTATITLTAKAGYTLTGVAVNFFTVANATSVMNGASSGVVIAVFPATLGVDYISSNIGTLKFIPAGRFQRDGIKTNISVITQPYRMSQYEITRSQFTAIMGTDPSTTTFSSGTSDPVQMANWYHAIAFCNKLSIAEDFAMVYEVSGVDFSTLIFSDIPTNDNITWNAATAVWTNNGYRLPTEMEWMWAAMGAPADGQKGGTNTTSYLKDFAGSTGSNVIGDFAVFGYHGSETGRTTTLRSNPVGSKTAGANELGLYDMSGNVWEWNWDRFGTYPTGTVTDYRGAASLSSRILRGGSWNYDASYCTVAYRYSGYPYSRYSFIGFRVVR